MTAYLKDDCTANDCAPQEETNSEIMLLPREEISYDEPLCCQMSLLPRRELSSKNHETSPTPLGDRPVQDPPISP